ncbi:hypothetical protein [Arthrobacter sp. CP30]
MPEQFLAPRYPSFAGVLDDAARQQLIETASMPFVYPHLASVPDAHLGKGCAVGTGLTLGGTIRTSPQQDPRRERTSGVTGDV